VCLKHWRIVTRRPGDQTHTQYKLVFGVMVTIENYTVLHWNLDPPIEQNIDLIPPSEDSQFAECLLPYTRSATPVLTNVWIITDMLKVPIHICSVSLYWTSALTYKTFDFTLLRSTIPALAEL